MEASCQRLPRPPFLQPSQRRVLDKAGFDQFCEETCVGFYHAALLGRPSLAPGMYFRIMTVGFFEGLDSERGIAWRLADSLTLRQFLSIGLDENTPDHVTISRTRRLIDGETHQRIFTWVLEQLAQDGLHQRQDHRSGFDYALEAECGDEVHRPARYGREL